MSDLGEGGQPRRSTLFMVLAVVYTAGLLYYYYTGRGGPILLAAVMVPFSFVIHSVDLYRRGQLYRKVPDPVRKASLLIAGILAGIVSIYIVDNFYDLSTVRVGSYNTLDVVVGAIAVGLVLEYSRRRHPALFAVNVFLIIYALTGSDWPGFLRHAGLSVERVITSLSVEFETGVFERLSQLALTLIGAFILFVGIAQGFNIVDSVVRVVGGYMARKPRLIPQAAVLSSMAVASVSGSGAANAATTGSVTIPLMKRIGLKGEIAGAVETAASLGGQLMPPIMGISAFIMADFLGVSYFDVIARGFMPALIYYVGIAVAVYLLASHYIKTDKLEVETIGRATKFDKARVLAFFLGIGILVFVMGWLHIAPMYSALIAAFYMLVVSSAIEYWQTRKLSSVGEGVFKSLDNFASFVADLTLLLATLGIMTGLLTVTGLPTKIGFSMMNIGAGNLLLLFIIAFVFGYLVGLGLPPAATFIITAIIIVPYMIQAGVNPWVAYFYAFFLGVFSELSPPTSVTAAVASKIADASFMKTMGYALLICIPLFILMPGVFLYPEIVIEPGLDQLLSGLVLIAVSVTIATGLWSSTKDQQSLLIRGLLVGLGILLLAAPIIGLSQTIVYGLSIIGIVSSVYIAKTI